MFRPEEEKAINTAVGAAVVIGVISFVGTLFACVAIAFQLSLIPVLVDPPPPTTWRDDLIRFSILAVPCTIAWIVMKLTYRFFRGLQLRG